MNPLVQNSAPSAPDEARAHPAGVCIHFDSLNEAFGFPPGFHDPSFHEVLDRFLAVADEFGFSGTVFVIGRDLENAEAFARVRALADRGWEIANHSWSHSVGLGSMSRARTREEIVRAHERIAECAGREPCGFVAPGWSTSRFVAETLIDLGYLYDASLYPSWWLIPMQGSVLVRHLFRHPRRVGHILRRRDWLYHVFGPADPMRISARLRRVRDGDADSLIVLPVPRARAIDPPFWHTLAFNYGAARLERELTRQLARRPYFYYLLHPADLIGPDDLAGIDRDHALTRIRVPLERKLDLVRTSIRRIVDSGRPLVTMEALARHFAVHAHGGAAA